MQWCHDNPDLVCFLHALRVELLVRMVMPTLVPTSPTQPFQYWVRFEEGLSGNPHAHGLCYAAGNPSLCGIESRRPRREGDMPEEDVQAQLREKLAEYFSTRASEWHPAKDGGDGRLYDFHIENLEDKTTGKPQTVDLKALLDKVLADDEPDLTPLKKLLLALIEDGQRHTMHGLNPRGRAPTRAPDRTRTTRTTRRWSAATATQRSSWTRRPRARAPCDSTRCGRGSTTCSWLGTTR